MTFIEPKAPMMHSAEPWTTDAFDVVDCSTGAPDYSAMIIAGDGESIIAQQMSDRDADRAAACVNALRGIPDPSAFTASVQELVRAAVDTFKLREIGDILDYFAAKDKFEAALATFRTATGAA